MKNFYTPEEVQIMVEMYPDYSSREIADHITEIRKQAGNPIPASNKTIQSIAFRRKIKKSPTFEARIQAKNKAALTSVLNGKKQSMADVVRNILSDNEKLTSKEISAITKWRTEKVHGVVSNMIQSGEILIVGKRNEGGKAVNVMSLSKESKEVNLARAKNENCHQELWNVLGLPTPKQIDKSVRVTKYDEAAFEHRPEKWKSVKVYITTTMALF